ncbi:MAG TPA: PAS domain S-box protein [Candidatus Saccharimonadales bacterium]|jgi:PAS domain S-box-containing protein
MAASGISTARAELFRMLQSIPALVGITYGPDHVYGFANSQYLKLLGKDESIIGKSVAQVFPELKGQGILEVLDDVYRTGKEFKAYEHRILLDTDNDGTPEEVYFNFTYQAIRDDKGAVEGIMSHAVEVSALVKSRQTTMENETRYRTLFNSIDEGFCLIEIIYDKHGNPVDYRFVETNKVFEKQTGLKDADGRTIRELSPDFEQQWIDRYAKVAAGGKSIRFIDGSKALGRWFDVHASRVADNADSRVAILFTDITKRKQAEAEQAAAVNEVTDVLESMGDAFFMLDKNWKIVRVNKVHERVTRTKRKEIVGKSFWDIFPDTPDSKYWIEHHKVMETRKPSHFIERYAPLDLWTETDVYPTREGGISVFFRDITAAKKAAEALKQSEERFRTLIEKSSDAIQLITPEGKILYSSESLKNVLGYTTEELEGVGVGPFLHPDDVAYFTSQIEKLLAKPSKPIVMHYRVKHKDGSWAWIETTGVNHLKTPNIGALVGTFRNITERKRAEEQTQYQKSLLEAQQEVSPLGIIVVSETGRIVSSNRRFADMWHMPDDVMATELDERVLEAAQSLLTDPQEFLDNVGAAYRERKPDNRQLHFKDGRTFDRYGAPIFGEDNRYHGYVWYFLDITEERQAVEALRASEERLRFMADSMPQKVFTATADGRSDYYNPLWMEYTGLGIEDIKDWGWTKFIHPDDAGLSVAAWNESIRTGKSFEIEQRFRRKDGKYHWHISRAQAMRGKDGTIIKWIGSSTDVDSIKRTLSRKKHLEEVNAALKEQRAQLIALNAAKDEFISLASHQLRTPATGVKQYLGMALDGFAGDVNTDMELLLSRAYQSNERQIIVINDLLKVAQVDAGKVHLRKRQTVLGQMVRDIAADQEAKFAERKQQVLIKTPSEDVSVLADPERLRMVFENLIDNASKYTPPGKRIALTVAVKQGAAQVTIEDEGVGIDPADMDKLFRKFSRLDNPLSIAVGGTGLGLYWAKKIIDLHDGTIQVDSVPGKGSLFTVLLPAV